MFFLVQGGVGREWVGLCDSCLWDSVCVHIYVIFLFYFFFFSFWEMVTKRSQLVLLTFKWMSLSSSIICWRFFLLIIQKRLKVISLDTFVFLHSLCIAHIFAWTCLYYLYDYSGKESLTTQWLLIFFPHINIELKGLHTWVLKYRPRV